MLPAQKDAECADGAEERKCVDAQLLSRFFKMTRTSRIFSFCPAGFSNNFFYLNELHNFSARD
jgi:hypothetical protein